MTAEQIAENFESVRNQIKEAEKKSGRNEDCVKLCAVSKFHPAEAVLAALKTGQTLFGENRVQEAFAKFTQINSVSKIKPELHIIGSLQTNKVKKAVEIASCIQSVDREELLAEIEKQCAKIEKKIEVFFEIHTGEDSKSGYKEKSVLIKSVENCANGIYPHIVPKGLMTMAPFTQDEKLIRASFSELRNLKDEVNKNFPSLEINELSMGMSGDYKIAIEEGSTLVRIGTALFGERDYS
ncbi:YggS family pyridoxal phosphate-dependent enzyme [uncultured Treponema sp.]|uniref:YggS family pyridoxal phosphate-dependent enzyme n=1 Tax=uncultured Treponema sp. TaxID=162155 RepID=UPI000E868C27|nr:YggS family pyridoxal phosphate-dependent enzyme [uncultured Treponema sp.]HAZ96882.1 YggS family pyridoxal phosphate-dependent enzyme [Treponema sp.]